MKTAAKEKEMDMLNGGIAGKLILFSLPLAFSSILQQLFNSADVAVVGRSGTGGRGKLRGTGRYLCQSDRRTFGGTKCRVSQSDRAEETGTDSGYASYGFNLRSSFGGISDASWYADGPACFGSIWHTGKRHDRSLIVYQDLFFEYSLYADLQFWVSSTSKLWRHQTPNVLSSGIRNRQRDPESGPCDLFPAGSIRRGDHIQKSV